MWQATRERRTGGGGRMNDLEMPEFGGGQGMNMASLEQAMDTVTMGGRRPAARKARAVRGGMAPLDDPSVGQMMSGLPPASGLQGGTEMGATSGGGARRRRSAGGACGMLTAGGGGAKAKAATKRGGGSCGMSPDANYGGGGGDGRDYGLGEGLYGGMISLADLAVPAVLIGTKYVVDSTSKRKRAAPKKKAAAAPKKKKTAATAAAAPKKTKTKAAASSAAPKKTKKKAATARVGGASCPFSE